MNSAGVVRPRNGSVIAFATNSANLISGLGGADQYASGHGPQSPVAASSAGRRRSVKSELLRPARLPLRSVPTESAWPSSVWATARRAAFQRLAKRICVRPAGGCPSPAGGPTISAASMKPAVFPFRSKRAARIRFRLDRKATVTFLVGTKGPEPGSATSAKRFDPGMPASPGAQAGLHRTVPPDGTCPPASTWCGSGAGSGRSGWAPAGTGCGCAPPTGSGNSRFVPLSPSG